jgi:hypothetical protein
LHPQEQIVPLHTEVQSSSLSHDRSLASSAGTSTQMPLSIEPSAPVSSDASASPPPPASTAPQYARVDEVSPFSQEQELHPPLQAHVVPDGWITPSSLQLNAASFAPASPLGVPLLEPLPQPRDSIAIATLKCDIARM